MKTRLRNIFASSDGRAVIFLIALSCLAHIPWLFSLSTFTSGDWSYISNAKFLDFVNISPLWVIDNLGDTSATPHFYLIRFFEGLIVALGGSFALTEKIFYLIPMALGASLFSYIFLRQYFRPSLACVGSIVYACNTSYLFNHAGPLNIGTVYALAPLGLWLFMRILTTKHTYITAAFASIVFALMTYYELRITLIVGLITGLWLVFQFVISDQKRLLAKQLVLPLTFFGAMLLLLNLFWLIPYVISSNEVTFSNLLERQLLVSFSDISNAITLHHPFWTGDRPATFIEQPIPLYAWLIPLIAFLGLLLPNRHKLHLDIIFWTIIGLGGILLIKQVNEPFVNFYPWIFERIPGFAAFRESSKFYLLVILAYSVLIPATLQQLRLYFVKDKSKINLKKWRGNWKHVVYYGAVFTACVLFLINIVPLVTGTFRTMYVAREMPADYAKLDQFLEKQDDYFRTLWYPTSSRWSTHTNKHPLVNAIGLDRDIWSRSLTMTDMTNATLRDKTTKLLSSSSADDLVDNMSVKYVIVPLRDTQSEDDFIRSYGDDRQHYIDTLDSISYLKRIDLGLSELAVYENTNYASYTSTSSSIQLTDSITPGDSFENIYNFTKHTLGEPFNIAFNDTKTKTLPATRITPITSSGNLQDHRSVTLYTNKGRANVSYTIKDNTITFTEEKVPSPIINGQEAFPAQSRSLSSHRLDPAKKYLLKIHEKIYDLDTRNTTRQLGLMRSTDIRVYEKEPKLSIDNASFQDGLWHRTVEDCNAYDSRADIAMNLRHEMRHGDKNVLSLGSANHTACTTSPDITIPMKANYLLQFDYRSEVANKVSYEIIYKGGEKKTIKKDIPVTTRNWTTHNEVIELDSSVISIRLIGNPDYRHKEYATTQYDQLSLTPLQSTASIDDYKQDRFEQSRVSSQHKNIQYELPKTDGKNIIKNSSFEKELWQQNVYDCHNYDNNGDIEMEKAKEGSDGNSSLQLSARTHVACTSTSAPVNEGATYNFSFDYKSPNAKSAGYTISFDDPQNTKIEKVVPVSSGNWSTYTKQIEAPFGATQATVTFYSYGSDLGRLKLINQYDNVKLTRGTNWSNAYYFVHRQSEALKTTPDVTFESRGNTYKKITVKNARDGFYLHLRESYNPLWKLYPERNDSLLQRIVPLGSTDGQNALTHLQVNGQQNVWYIDTKKYCNDTGDCKRNDDGSYTIDFIAEFSPQRYFYIGSIVSIATFLGLIAFIIVSKRRRS